jgi:hypothetical protein
LALVAVASAGVVSPVAYAPAGATYLTRAPAFDSAVIKSDRLGGNFAYSVAESHAYAAHTPVVQHVTSPVAVSYSAPSVYAAAVPSHYASAASVYGNRAFGYGYGYPGYGYGYAAAAPAYGYATYLKK